MIVPDRHVEFLKQPLSFWLATTNKTNMPEPLKCTGIRFDPLTDIFTCFVPRKFTETAFNHLSENPVISLVGVDVHSYEGYQYKGDYLAHRDCTKEEETCQAHYMQEFCAILESFGYSGSGFYQTYMRPPFVAITFKATQVFDQSPKVGTGGQIANSLT